MPGSPIFTVSDSASTVFPGETVRVGADDYEVLRTGVEMQVISLSCATGEGNCGGIALEFDLKSKTAGSDLAGSLTDVTRSVTSHCIHREHNSNMTTAESLSLWFNLVPFVNKGDVEVTRSDSIDGEAYAFSIYFSGDSVAFNVPSVSVTTCTSLTLRLPTRAPLTA